jgi:hypothetical protein
MRPLMIRAPVMNGLHDPVDSTAFDGMIQLGKTCDSTHKLPG